VGRGVAAGLDPQDFADSADSAAEFELAGCRRHRKEDFCEVSGVEMCLGGLKTKPTDGSVERKTGVYWPRRGPELPAEQIELYRQPSVSASLESVHNGTPCEAGSTTKSGSRFCWVKTRCKSRSISA